MRLNTRLGQLAIARGLIGLTDLLNCVEEAVHTRSELATVLVQRGMVTSAQLQEMQSRLSGGAQELDAELERGHTLVMDELYVSRIQPALTTGDDPGMLATQEIDLADIEFNLELSNEHRYDIGRELGRGGMGSVRLARDLILRRDVAIKTLLPEALDEKGKARLLLEAQVTGLLEHPSIVPVYDLRSTDDGEPFYTMRVVQEQSLEEILADIRRGESSQSLSNLVSILRQVSLAVQYAHDLGVVHRDLKPENILVGKYGEVYVIDWGVAKIVSSEKIGIEQTGKVVMGQLVGTPFYMAPEQARGANDDVDERSDVYALGAILYEILTLGTMFQADHVLAILFQVVHEEPELPSERAPDRHVPAELEEICMQAVRKAPRERFQTAQQFADELELFLEGVKERERREQMAHDAFQQAKQVEAIYLETRAQFASLSASLSSERNRIESWDPPEKKADLWSLQQQVEELEVEIERRFGEVVRSYGQALVHRSDMPEAREALGRLYCVRFLENERTGRLAQAVYFEGLVRQYNDGQWDDLLEGNARLAIETTPANAEVELLMYQDVDRRLQEWPVAELGDSPIYDVVVSHGSYLLRLDADGYRPTRVPVLAERGASFKVPVRLRTLDEIPDGFVHIPGGEYISGRVRPGVEVVRKYVDDFAIAQYPVTVGQYVQFLNSLVKSGRADEAKERAPHDNVDVYLEELDDGTFRIPETDPQGDVWNPRWPMIIVNYHDGSAYAEWLSEQTGLPFRLPTIDEWEKAARGVDGRVYPWGDHFDASFCLMRGSRAGRSAPEPVGSFPIDCSPYGVMDVCGGVAEWTSTLEASSEHVRYLGGASYNSFAEFCALDLFLSSPSSYRFGHYGFRLALSLS